MTVLNRVDSFINSPLTLLLSSSQGRKGGRKDGGRKKEGKEGGG